MKAWGGRPARGVGAIRAILAAMGTANKIVIALTGDPVDEIRERRGDFGDIIANSIGEDYSGNYHVFDARSSPELPDVREARALILTGSSANVPRREPWMLRTEAWLRDVVGDGPPTLGICFGHQILAQALGGEVIRNPRGREMSTVCIERTEKADPLLAGLDATFQANACHSDTVDQLPSGAVALAKSELDPHQCIRFSERCYGVQFHPEFDRDVMRAYVRARSTAISHEGGDPRALLQRAGGAPGGHRVLLQFIKRFVK